jgi:hypothetical protein
LLREIQGKNFDRHLSAKSAAKVLLICIMAIGFPPPDKLRIGILGKLKA